MRTVVFPGSFDPVTLGHVDLVRRTAKLFDRTIVAVATSLRKKCLFSNEERIEMAREALADISGVEVLGCAGLTAEFARLQGACTLLRGVRNATDIEYELQLAMMNRRLVPDLDTLFMAPAPEYIGLSSSLVREIATFGGDTESFVPATVNRRIRQKFADAP